uniref:Ribosomal protein S3 n=1 Tax=Pleurosigma intermedium TaxID=197753 RepID=A0A8F9R468_9STRA|nr:ribosomal protein S3 [Pleurosigma sp. mgcode 4]
MGQKTNTRNIFQIGKNNNKYIWDSKYFEKKKNESNIFIYQNIEIKKFIKKILKDNGLILHKYRISFLESNIKIFVSYLKLPKSQTIINQINSDNKLRLIKNRSNKKNCNKDIKAYLDTKKYINNKKNIFNNKIDVNSYNKENFKNQSLKICLLNNLLINKQKHIQDKEITVKNNINLLINYILTEETKKRVKKKYSNITRETNLEKINKIVGKLLIENKKIKKRVKILQYYKYYMKIKNNKIMKNIKINNFLEKIIESISIFTQNKFNITLNLQQVNNNLTFKLTSYQLQHFKKAVIQLRQFNKSKFFKEGINIIFLSLIKKDSSQLLANFIANQLKLVKRHGFFLKFLKKALSLMLVSKLSKTTGIKIVIKGRFNGKRRSSKKIITINKNMPLMTLKSNIDSAQSTAYGSNGTFGIKLWMNEKII